MGVGRLIVGRVEGVVRGVFLRRPNRFVVEARLPGGRRARCLNTNTGRLGELLAPGARLLCTPKPGGRTSHRLLGVEVGGRVAIVDTGFQMGVFETLVGEGLLPWLRGCRIASRAPRVGASVLDYRLDCGGVGVLVEVKSAVLLHSGGKAGYPDCPTDRGVRHLRELGALAERGEGAMVVFIAAVPGARGFAPYAPGDPRVVDALREAVSRGVEVRAIGVEGLLAGEGVVLVNVYSANLPVFL